MVKKVTESYKHNLLAFIVGPMLKMVEAFFDLLIPLIMKSIIDLSKFNTPELIPESNPISRFLAAFVRSFGTWVDDNQSLSDVLVGFVIIISMGIIGFLITMVTQYIAAKTAMKVGTEVRNSLFDKTISLSKKEKEKIGNNKLLTILNADSYQIQQGVLIFIRLIVRAPFIILGALIISFFLDYKIGLVFTAIIPLILIVVFLVMNHSSKEYLKIQEQLDDISSSTSETLDGAKVIRSYNKQDYEEKRFSEKTSTYKKSAIHVGKINALINPLTFAIISIATLFVVIIAGLPILSSTSGEGVLIASTIITEIAYLAQIFTTLVQLTNVVLIITKSRVSRKRTDELLAMNSTIENDENGITKQISHGDEIFKFQDVSLGYEDGCNLALSHISFSLDTGQSLGIIGGTGSGKSTIVSLMERLLDATSGQVFYKGVDIKDYCLDSLRKELGLVMQKSKLLKGTIRSNMKMANPNASDEEIVVALKDAKSYDFIKKYPDLLDHEVCEGGTNFSGGQKQRLCIARALVKKPEILILDDATSALDYLTDKAVRKNIEKGYEGVTKIYISQRVSTIQDCDLILVLDGGKLVAQGNHEKLLKDSSIYKETYDSQVKKGAL
jgi:ATP-binding cassette, subfamily B, multidrug efflux pump